MTAHSIMPRYCAGRDCALTAGALSTQQSSRYREILGGAKVLDGATIVGGAYVRDRVDEPVVFRACLALV